MLASDCGVALSASGQVQCRTPAGVHALEGAPPHVVRGILELVDGARSAEEIARALGADAASAREVLGALLQVGVLRTRSPEPPPRHERLALVGNGPLLRALDEALAVAGWRNRERVLVERFASLEAHAERILSPRLEPDSGPFDRRIARATPSDLRSLAAEFDGIVCCIEGEPFGALLDVNRAALEAGKPCLVVTPEVIGPLTLGRAGPCFECWLRASYGAIDSMPFASAPRCADAQHAERVARLALRLLLDSGPTVHVLHVLGEQPEVLLASAQCTSCRADDAEPISAALATASEIGRFWPLPPEIEVPRAPDAYRTVGIVGGGTAGYLTALALKRHRPELDVTLIESSQIPVIGVGEATTPELVRMLHSPRFLGKDIVDFYARVKPTWKLGIKFQFGPRDFTFPFQRGRLLESQVHDGHLQHQSLGAMLMAMDRSPVIRDEGGHTQSLAHLVRGAYHLENRRFVRYLSEEALADGVRHVDAQITEIVPAADGQSVDALVTDDGRRFSFDLYVDCSGFRSLLLEGALGSPFRDWSSTLLTDRAIAASVPHDGTVKPYTLAETMDAGWCWNIPFEDEDHRGYVFCSGALDADRAEAEMRRKNPGMGDAALIRFRSGRHEHLWKGNTVAIGNSYGFVEPLESTAIHMIVLTLELLTTHFPSSRHDHAVKQTLNRKVAERWDALRWFLGIHYRFNHRLDTPFWRTARSEVDISGAEERVALFRERAPLSYRTSLFYTVLPPEFFSDDHSFDTLLMGLDVPARYVEPAEDRATWERRRSSLRQVARGALPQAAALDWLRSHPDQQRRVVSEPESWLHLAVPA